VVRMLERAPSGTRISKPRSAIPRRRTRAFSAYRAIRLETPSASNSTKACRMAWRTWTAGVNGVLSRSWVV
jgi:hypothetical protein